MLPGAGLDGDICFMGIMTWHRQSYSVTYLLSHSEHGRSKKKPKPEPTSNISFVFSFLAYENQPEGGDVLQLPCLNPRGTKLGEALPGHLRDWTSRETL